MSGDGGALPQRVETDGLRTQYEQMRERILARDPTGEAGDLFMQRGMRSWIEAGEPRPAPRTLPAERQPTDADWKPIVPVIAGLLLRLAERSAYGAPIA